MFHVWKFDSSKSSSKSSHGHMYIIPGPPRHIGIWGELFGRIFNPVPNRGGGNLIDFSLPYFCYSGTPGYNRQSEKLTRRNWLGGDSENNPPLILVKI